jgi:hypothetical protein
MHPRWTILGLFLAGIVYGTIIWQPEKPMWTAHYSGFSHFLGFNEDSTSIFIVDNLGNGDVSPFTPNLSQLDAITGKLLRELPIKFQNPQFKDPVEYTLSGDGKSLIVMEPISYLFYVFDTATAQQRLGPIHCWWRPGNTKFSRDGRWIVYHFRTAMDSLDDGGIEVIDSKTGNKVLRVKTTENESIADTCFSPDDSAIALSQHDSRDDFSIRIFELPGGKERHRFPLSKHDWVYLEAWKDDRLTVLDTHRPVAEWITKVFTIDLKSTPVGHEVEYPELERRRHYTQSGRLVTNWQEYESGNGWRADVEYGASEQDWIRKYWKKFTEWIGLQRNVAFGSGTEVRLRLHDSDTEKTRYESPVFIDSTPYIAANGASYAMWTNGGGNGGMDLSVWNANPSPRWPWALAASLGALLAILFFGRWRYKRTKIA